MSMGSGLQRIGLQTIFIKVFKTILVFKIMFVQLASGELCIKIAVISKQLMQHV